MTSPLRCCHRPLTTQHGRSGAHTRIQLPAHMLQTPLHQHLNPSVIKSIQKCPQANPPTLSLNHPCSAATPRYVPLPLPLPLPPCCSSLTLASAVCPRGCVFRPRLRVRPTNQRSRRSGNARRQSPVLRSTHTVDASRQCREDSRAGHRL